MHLIAPAKINLSLKILGKRADGYHELETLMVPISLADEIQLTIRPNGGITLSTDDPSLPLDSDNLVHRAATVFEKAIGHPLHAQIHLKKKIPTGAGLGGGSSDAAAILLGLNQHFDQPFDQTQLVTMACQLGADVPFFLFRSPAWCRGIGEKIEPTHLPEGPLSLLLIKPPFPIPTPWAYRGCMEALRRKAECGTRNAEVILHQSPQSFGDLTLINDLEPVVFEKYILLPVLKQWLLSQPEVKAALMSGSGSTIFCILKSSQTPINSLTNRITEAFGKTMWTHRCETLNEKK